MAKKPDLQLKAAELGIEFTDATTVAELEALIAEKEAANPPAPTPPAEPGAGTPPVDPVPPTTPTKPKETQFEVEIPAGAEFVIARSVDGKFVRIFDKFKRPISGTVNAADSGEVEKLGRECARHNALASQRNPRKK